MLYAIQGFYLFSEFDLVISVRNKTLDPVVTY